MRVDRKGPAKNDARHLPVAGGCVFARCGERAFAERAGRRSDGRDAWQRLDITEAEAPKIGQVQRPAARDIAQSVAADVAVGGGIRHGPDADTIEDNPDDPIEDPAHFDLLSAAAAADTFWN